MGIWQDFCEKTHINGFFELYDSNSKLWKAVWLTAVGLAILATGWLVFNAAEDFIKQPVRIMIEQEKPSSIPYPPLKFCFLHWMAWVDWKEVQKYQFSKAELLYSLSYIDENVYSSEIFNVSEVEVSVKSKLNTLNFTLKLFFEHIAAWKLLLLDSPFTIRSAELTLLRKPFYRDIFDSQYLMCYIYKEGNVQNVLKDENNHRLQIDVVNPYLDDHEYFLTNHEYNKHIKGLIEKWHLDTNEDYSNNIPIVLYPDGHSSSYVRLDSHQFSFAIEVSMSAYIQKYSKNNAESCNNEVKNVMTNATPIEECIEKSRAIIFDENNAEEPWLGFMDNVSPKKIHFLNKIGNVIENSTFVRRHKLENMFYSQVNFERMSNISREVVDICSDKSAQNGCEVWDIEFNHIETEPNGNSTMYLYYPTLDQITIMNEVDVQTWSNFVAEVGGVLGIWTGASILTLFQIFYLLFHCYSESE